MILGKNYPPYLQLLHREKLKSKGLGDGKYSKASVNTIPDLWHGQSKEGFLKFFILL